MKPIGILRVATIAVVAGALALGVGAGAIAQEKVRWKMQGTFPGKLLVIGTAGKFLSKQISSISGGTFNIKWYEPNALVPALEAFDAVRAGSVDAAYGVSAYWAGKIPAAVLFTTYPFGPGAAEYLAWIEHGGGQQLWDEIYQPFGVKGIPCAAIGPEASGWFQKEMKSVDDFAGLKVRYGGFGAKVLQKLGASTQMIAGGDVFAALERGTIDAAEFSMPAIDLGLGFHQIIKHYYFPGWHQPGTVLELLVNLDKWKALSGMQRAQLEIVCKATVLRSLVESNTVQGPAIESMKSEGVMIHRWPPEFIAAFRDAWAEVVKEESAKDADFKRVWGSIAAFRRNYAVWQEVGFLD